jgi:hypothetical protein
MTCVLDILLARGHSNIPLEVSKRIFHTFGSYQEDILTCLWQLGRAHCNIPVEVSKPVPSQGCRKSYVKALFMCLLLLSMIWNRHQTLQHYSCRGDLSHHSEIKLLRVMSTRREHTKWRFWCDARFSRLWLWRRLSCGIRHKFIDVSGKVLPFYPEDGEARSFETSINVYQTTRRHVSQDSKLKNLRYIGRH